VGRIIRQVTQPHPAAFGCAQNDDIGLTTGIEALHSVQAPPCLDGRLLQFEFLSLVIKVRVLPLRAAATITTQKHGEAG